MTAVVVVVVLTAMAVVTAVVFAAYTICLQCPPCSFFGGNVCLLEGRGADWMRIFGAAGGVRGEEQGVLRNELRRTTRCIRAACGLAGQTSFETPGFGLAFTMADGATDQRSASGAGGVGEAPISVLRLCADPPIGGWRDVPTRVMMGT